MADIFHTLHVTAYRHYPRRGTPNLCLNSAGTKMFVCAGGGSSTMDDVRMMVYDLINNTVSYVAAGVTWAGGTDPYGPSSESVAQGEVGVETANEFRVVLMTSDAQNPWSDYAMFEGTFNVETELWVTKSHTYTFDIDVHSTHLSRLWYIDGKSVFVGYGTSGASMGVKYHRHGIWYKDTVWTTITDETTAAEANGTVSLSQYSEWEADDDVIVHFDSYDDANWVGWEDWVGWDDPTWVDNTRQVRTNSQYHEPIRAYTGINCNCYITGGVSKNLTFVQSKNSNQTASTTPDPSLYLIDPVYYQVNPTETFVQYIVGTWKFNSGDPLSYGIMVLGSDDLITDYYEFSTQSTASYIAGVFHIWEDEDDIHYAGYNQTLDFMYHRIGKGSVSNDAEGVLLRGEATLASTADIKYINEAEGALLRGEATLLGTVEFLISPDIIVDGDFTRNQSTILGSGSVLLELAVSEADLIRGNSILDGYATLIQPFVNCSGALIRGQSVLDCDIRNQFFYFYSVESYTDVAKTKSVLENVRFTATINGTDYPMTGFSIRSSLVNSELTISNTIECRFYMTPAQMDIIIPLIDSGILTIKSLYNFGSTSVETTLFTGVVRSAIKRVLTPFSMVTANNSEFPSSSGIYEPPSPIMISGSMSRLEFDHVIKPKDTVLIDGSERVINRVVSYNYNGSGSFTEVYYG